MELETVTSFIEGFSSKYPQVYLSLLDELKIYSSEAKNILRDVEQKEIHEEYEKLEAINSNFTRILTLRENIINVLTKMKGEFSELEIARKKFMKSQLEK